MKPIILFVIVLFSTYSFSQFSSSEYASKIDSLMLLKPSKENLEAINEIAFQWKYVDYDITTSASNYVLENSDQPGYESINAFSNKLQGIIFDLNGKYQTAVQYYLKAIDKYKLIKYDLDIAKCEANIGMIFRKQRKFDNALKYFENSLVTFENEDFGYGIMNINSNLGIVYMELEKPDLSIFYLKEAEIKMKELQIFDHNIYGNLGNSYSMNNQIDLAEINFLKCINYKK